MENSIKATNAHVLGEMVWLLTQSPAYSQVQIGKLETLLMPPILLKQFRIFHDDKQMPVGFATWVKASEEEIVKLKQQISNEAFVASQLKSWKSGDIPFLIDFVCPFATEQNQLSQKLIQNLQVNIFKNQPISGVRGSFGKKMKTISKRFT